MYIYNTHIVLLFFFGGLILLGIGILGEYLARIYEELKDRPLYIISEKAKNQE